MAHPHSIPRVSVGIPVYNGERFLKGAIDSLLSQRFTDFEILISDNASTDGTQAICEEYVANDQRVSYFRQRTNIGAPGNWNYVAKLARGTYFKWASANDECDPRMLDQCVAVL